jgi:hypothetical protein
MRHDEPPPAAPAGSREEIAFREGLLVGILVGEGHFGGDGKQPQVTLRMHTRHSQLFDWIQASFPGGKLFGPYFHGGRHYFQWMARGRFLREVLVPILSRRLTAEVDIKSYGCYVEMLTTYGVTAPREAQPAQPPAIADAPQLPRRAAALVPSSSASTAATDAGQAADSDHI